MTPTCDVEVWLVSLLCDRQIVLSADEAIRAARFRFEADRARWIRARSALRTILADHSGTPAAEIQFTFGAHGKPALADANCIEFSLSHAGDFAMIAVTRDVPVGIDIERIRENINMAALLARLGEASPLPTQEGRFSAWTRREAMTKALGGALLAAPAGDLRVLNLDAPKGYCASLAVVGHDPRVSTITFV